MSGENVFSIQNACLKLPLCNIVPGTMKRQQKILK